MSVEQSPYQQFVDSYSPDIPIGKEGAFTLGWALENMDMCPVHDEKNKPNPALMMHWLAQRIVEAGTPLSPEHEQYLTRPE